MPIFYAPEKAKELYRKIYGQYPVKYRDFVEANSLYAKAKKAGKTISKTTGVMKRTDQCVNEALKGVGGILLLVLSLLLIAIAISGICFL